MVFHPIKREQATNNKVVTIIIMFNKVHIATFGLKSGAMQTSLGALAQYNTMDECCAPSLYLWALCAVLRAKKAIQRKTRFACSAHFAPVFGTRGTEQNLAPRSC